MNEMNRDKYLWEELCGDGRRKICEFLEFWDYDPSEGVYLMKDGTLGFIFEFYPILGLDERRQKALADIFSVDILSDGDSIQIINYANDFIQMMVESYLDNKNTQNETLSKYCDSNASYIMKAKTVGFKGFPELYTPKDFKVLITFRTGLHVINGLLDIKGLFKSIESIKSVFGISNDNGTAERYHEEYKRLLKIKKEFGNLLKQAGTDYRNYTPIELVWYFSRIFGKKDLRLFYKPGKILAEQLVDASMPVSVEDMEFIKAGDQQISVVSVKEYPDQIDAWQTSDMIGSFMNDRNQMPSNTVSCLNVKIRDQNAMKNMINEKILYYNTFKAFPKAREKIEELKHLTTQISSGNHLHEGFLGFFTIRNESNAYDIQDATRNLVSQVETAGYQAQKETLIKLPLLLGMLPLNFNTRYLDFYERKKTLNSWNCSSIAPAYGDIKGNSDIPAMFYISRRSQLYAFNPFSTGEDHYTSLFIGGPGSGKSFQIQCLSYNLLAMNAIVVIMEVGHSYEKSTKHIGGRYLDFGSDEYPSMNPFLTLGSGEITPEEHMNLTTIFSFMISPRRVLDKRDEGYVSKAVKKVAMDLGVRGRVEDVQKALKEDSKELSDALWIYTADGANGKLFDGQRQGFIFDNQLTAISFQPVEKIGEDLLTLQYMVAIAKASGIVYAKENLHLPKMVCYDEFHNVNNNPYISPLIAKQARQYRKNKGSVIIGTQTLEDIYCNEYAKVLADTAAYQFVFKQKTATIERLKSENKLGLSNPGIDNLLKSVNSVKGKYSEFMLMTQNGNTVLRYIGSPMDKALFGSEADEMMKIRKYQESGMNLAEAIDKYAGEMAS